MANKKNMLSIKEKMEIINEFDREKISVREIARK